MKKKGILVAAATFLAASQLVFAPDLVRAQSSPEQAESVLTNGTSEPVAEQAFDAGYAAWLDSDWVGATRHFERAKERDPQFPLARAFHAVLVGGSEAATEVQRAITMARGEELTQQLILLALKEDALGRDAAARHIIAAAARLAPGEDRLLADFHTRLQRDPETRIAAARELVERKPDSYQSHLFIVRAKSLTSEGGEAAVQTDSSEAFEALERAMQLGPERPATHWAAGELKTALHRYEEALGHYRDAVALDDAYYQARLDAAQVALYTERYPDARRELEEALPHVLSVEHRGMIRRAHALTHMYEGNIERTQELLAESAAASESEKALHEAALAHRQLAVVAGVKRDSAGVADHIEEQRRLGLEGDVTYNYWNALAWAFAGQPQLAWDRVEEHTREMERGDVPYWQFALDIITGATLTAEGRYEEALDAFEGEDNQFALLIGARSLRELGRHEEADERMRRVFESTGYRLTAFAIPLAHWQRHNQGL